MHTVKFGSGDEREAILPNLLLASPLHGGDWYPLASGAGPQGLGFDFPGVEFHAPRQGSRQRQNEAEAVTVPMASSHPSPRIAVEGVLPSLMLSLGPFQKPRLRVFFSSLPGGCCQCLILYTSPLLHKTDKVILVPTVEPRFTHSIITFVKSVTT